MVVPKKEKKLLIGVGMAMYRQDSSDMTNSQSIVSTIE